MFRFFALVCALAVGVGSTCEASDLETIFALQAKLQRIGLYEGELDGQTGPKTQAALDKAAERFETEPTIEAVYGYFAREVLQYRKEITSEEVKTGIKEEIGQYLKDPFSAQYENFYALRSGRACVEVNSKNNFGAYTGWKTFALSPMIGNGWMISAYEESGNGLADQYCTIDM